jgi:hypothetical protein
MGISSYYFKNVEAKLIQNEYWDFYLSSDNQGCKVDYATKCNDKCTYPIIEDSLVVWFDVNQTGTTVDGSSLTSLTTWSESIVKPSSGITLCDFGLTGVDNGRYNQLSGITVNITSADTKVVLYPVTGYTINSVTGVTTNGKYNYDWHFRNGDVTTDGCQVGKNVCLDGGFYQGYFKLDFLEPNPVEVTVTGGTPSCVNDIKTELQPTDPNATVYDLMPTTFDTGWSMETWVNPSNTVCNTYNEPTLNKDFTGNTGFFFYIGTRAENKFQNVFSGESGLYTCDGSLPLQPDIKVNVINGFENWFLKSNYNFTNRGCGCFTGCTTVTTGTTTATTYCDQLSENALGFRITPDGRIGYRKMTVSTGCYNFKDRITGTTMEEGYSETPVILSGDNWVHIVVTYTQNSVKHGLPAGTLKFWVNGRVIYRVEDFIGLQLRALDEWSNKQLGVPFNMSWGGGSQGLLESQTFGGPDPEDQNLDIAKYFAGTFDGRLSQLRFYEKPLNLLEIRNNLYVDCPRYCVKVTYGGAQIVQPNSNFCGVCKSGSPANYLLHSDYCYIITEYGEKIIL